ncbi:MAG: FAD-dependent oxidoreductase [Proteobacteria bacterium]|nr:FAD-dependent oxidoreductase [Pseudomonadota bacterium]
MNATHPLPTHADVVVIGGGIIGCSTAYHLAKNHKLNVVLLEQNRLTSGSTWHAAGLVGQLRSSASITQVLKYSVELYKNLETETGLQTGWKMTGCLRLANNLDRWTEYKRLATTAQSFGMEMQLLSALEARELWPLLEVRDVVGATFLPTDGQASPTDITQALAKGARMHGAKLVEGTRVESFNVLNQRIVSINTNRGTIYCEKVVNCGGMWARQIAAMVGAHVPLQPVKHQYVITERLPGLATDAPTIRDPDLRTYFKEEVGGLVFGGYEPNPVAWTEADVPSDFEFQLFEDDFGHFEQHMEAALKRIPALEQTGIKKMINGPESFTPDGNFILGAMPECKNMYVGAGFNAFGIASGGGAGWVLADWVARDEAPMDLWTVDVRRFSGLHHDRSFVTARTLEAYGKHYTVGFPHEEYTSARDRIVSPIYNRLRDRGACFGAKLGWERANWFAPKGVEARDVYSMGRQNWFPHAGAEHRAVREAAGLFDQSSFAKFEVKGRNATKTLEYICANSIDRPVGSVIYTQMLNSRGGIECDLTVTRLGREHYYVVTGTGFRTHDLHWILDHVAYEKGVTVEDVTEDWGTLVLMGPRSRDIIGDVTLHNMGNDVFPFGQCRIISMVGHDVRAVRVSYVGELGWELHAPMNALPVIFDGLMRMGEPRGLKLAGYRALEALRLEKGYRAWSSDITPNDNPFEAGLGWAVKLKNETDFIGRKALLQASNQAPRKLLTTFTTEREDVVLVGRETILRDGKFAGYLTSGGYGYTIGKPIGMGYVRNPAGVTPDYVLSGSYELVVAKETVKATPHLKPLYDPGNARLKS